MGSGADFDMDDGNRARNVCVSLPLSSYFFLLYLDSLKTILKTASNLEVPWTNRVFFYYFIFRNYWLIGKPVVFDTFSWLISRTAWCL